MARYSTDREPDTGVGYERDRHVERAGTGHRRHYEPRHRAEGAPMTRRSNFIWPSETIGAMLDASPELNALIAERAAERHAAYYAAAKHWLLGALHYIGTLSHAVDVARILTASSGERIRVSLA